jgi:hypothetical protein
MDVKQVTGFDVLKKIQMYNKNLLQELKMSVFNDKCYKEAALDSRNVYLYDKLSKNVGYAIKQDFAYMYNKLLSSLYTLTYKQQFDSVKDLSIKKYNQYPAYPKVNFINNDVLKKPYDSLISLMENNIQSIKGIKQQILTYEYAHSLAKLAKRVDENGGLTPRNKIKLQQIIQKMYEVNSDNDAGNVLLDTLAAAMILSDSATWEEYSPIVECILDQVAEIEDLSSKEGLNDTIDNLRATTRTNMQQYATIYVQTKYQNTVIELMNKLENSMKNNNKELTESLKRELYNSLEKYHILRNPKDLLDNYIKFNAKDSIDKNDLKLNEIYKNLMIRALNYARLVAVQDLIMEATRSGASLSVKDELDEYVIKLKEQGFVNLKDPKSIALMTNSLIVDENTEIASLFLNKFGLSEIYVKEIIDSTNIEELKRNADAVAKEVDNFKKFQEALVPYFEKISQSFDNEDGEEFVHLKKLNSIIKKKAKEYSIDRNVAKIYQSAIDSTIDAIQQHQENSRKDVLYTVAMSKAQSAVMNICQQSFNKEAEIVKSIVQIVELVGDIPLTKDTKLSTERELFIEKIQEFLNDRQKLLDLQDE